MRFNFIARYSNPRHDVSLTVNPEGNRAQQRRARNEARNRISTNNRIRSIAHCPFPFWRARIKSLRASPSGTIGIHSPLALGWSTKLFPPRLASIIPRSNRTGYSRASDYSDSEAERSNRPNVRLIPAPCYPHPIYKTSFFYTRKYELTFASTRDKEVESMLRILLIATAHAKLDWLLAKKKNNSFI